MRGPTLRLVCVNDVYLLDHLPRLRALVRHLAANDPADLLLTTLAGDFVAPSLLSSLDRGHGMVDCLNAVPITHVCFGNHEQDIPAEALAARVTEFRGTWLNTNIPGFRPALPASQVVEVRGEGTRAVRVALLGGVTEDPSLYRPNPFGGNAIEPLNATLLRAADALARDAGCACAIALTHQSLPRDEALARAQTSIPVIVGGHEHEPHVERVGSAWVIKAGTEAAYAAIVDLAWPAEPPAEGPDHPTVSVRLERVTDHPDDPCLRARAEGHLRAVHALRSATLYRLAPGEALSSVGTRVRQTSVGALIASKVRDALGADVCMINGGGIRASRDYATEFTFGDLEAELPFPNEVVVAVMPGRALREAVASSRARAPTPSPGFLQLDDGAVVGEDNVLREVAGAAFDDAREYRVATVRVLFDGMDGIEALVRFRNEHPERIPPADSGRELKLIVVEAFAMDLWRAIGPFSEIDTDGDDAVSADELRAAVARVTQSAPSSLLIDSVIRTLDADGDRRISRAEADKARG